MRFRERFFGVKWFRIGLVSCSISLLFSGCRMVRGWFSWRVLGDLVILRMEVRSYGLGGVSIFVELRVGLVFGGYFVRVWGKSEWFKWFF